MRKFDIKPGDRFNHWTVLEDMGSANKRRIVKCRCDYGNEKVLYLETIVRGRSKSCGCRLCNPIKCTDEYRKQYKKEDYAKNRERYLAYSREYYKANKEKLKAYKANWYRQRKAAGKVS